MKYSIKTIYVLSLHVLILVLITVLAVALYHHKQTLEWERHVSHASGSLPEDLALPNELFETQLENGGFISVMGDGGKEVSIIYVRPPRSDFLWRFKLSSSGLGWEYYVSYMPGSNPDFRSRPVEFRYSDLDGDGMPETRTTWIPTFGQSTLVNEPWQ